MLVDLLKQQPNNILEFMKEWMHKKGAEIRNANQSGKEEAKAEEAKPEEAKPEEA